MVKTVECPQCKATVNWQDDELWKPFCSERCKLIDLGDWASENHKIAGESVISSENDPNEFH